MAYYGKPQPDGGSCGGISFSSWGEISKSSFGEQLDQEKLTPLLRLKYHNSISDALADLGPAESIGQVFLGFQKYLYQHQTGA
jgi:hypothetical protein